MLRARTWKEPGNSSVCAFCRKKLSTGPSRRFSHTTNSLPALRTSPRSRCSVPHSTGVARALSTSAVLRAPGDNEGFKPGAFGAGLSGGFGSTSTFGGFGIKVGGLSGSTPSPAPSTAPSSTPSSTPSLDALLPHEREARLRQKLIPQKKIVSRDTTASRAASSHNQNQNPRKNQRNQRNHRAEGRHGRSNDTAVQHNSSTSASALLAEAFKKTHSPKPPPTPKSWSGDQTAESLEAEAEPSAPAVNPMAQWGAFKSRPVEIKVPTPRHESRGALRPRKQGNEGQAEGSSGDPWDKLVQGRRGEGDAVRSTSKQDDGQDFWDALENRVSGFSKSGGLRPPKLDPSAVEELVLGQPAEQVEGEAEELPRRNSRFEAEDGEEGESGGSSRKKEKQRKKNSRRQKHEDDDMDDEALKRWEARQRRKAEKEASKHAGQQVEQQAPQMSLPEYISVANLAQALKLRVANFLNDLGEMGFEDLTEDTIMTGDTAALVVMEYGFEPRVDNGAQLDLRPRPPPADPSALPQRPPVVTIMGHVDHGKTTLLDWLRKSSIAAQEHGGITQHIGAFVVKMSSGKPITFLDTPGHAAFLSMRQRGANVTDIVVLVVAADDSVMPQTIEALKHATAAKVPIIVAINKIDKEDARVDQVKADLARNGVEIEDYGGDVQVVCVSGKTGQGMEDLEENIVTLSEILDVRAEDDGMAEGWILESSVKQNGKAATVLVKRGTLRLGDYIVAGKTWARVRVLRNEAGVEISEAPPGTPVEILGWRDLPEAGEQVLQSPDEDKAKTAIEYRQEMSDREQSSIQLAQQEQRQREKAAAEEAAALAEADGSEATSEASPEPGVSKQNFIIKADVAGSVEAVCGTVQELGNHEVQPRILRSNVGPISEYDIDQAATSNGIIVNFNNPVQPHIRQRATEAKVRIIDHSVIYHVADEVTGVLSDLLPYRITHRVLGEADVLQIFSINVKKRVHKNIAGCKIRNGAIKRNSRVKVLRGGKIIFDGKIDTLKHVKKDVMEMGKGSECGIGLEDFQDLEIDDQIQTYEELKEKRSL